MNGHQLQQALERIFGDGWRKKTRAWLGISESTLVRQVNGTIEVQGPVKAAVEAKEIVVRYQRADMHRQRRARFGKVNASQLEVLQFANAGIDPNFQPPTPIAKIVGRRNTIASCVRRGFMDEAFVLTELGRKVLGEDA